MSSEAVSAAIHNNRLWPQFKQCFARLDDLASFSIVCAKFQKWLSNPKAYYAEAQPHIIDLLQTAQSTVMQMAGFNDPRTHLFRATAYPNHPWCQAYINVVKSIQPYVGAFELDLQKKAAALLQTVSNPPSPTDTDRPSLSPKTKISIQIPPGFVSPTLPTPVIASQTTSTSGTLPTPPSTALKPKRKKSLKLDALFAQDLEWFQNRAKEKEPVKEPEVAVQGTGPGGEPQAPAAPVQERAVEEAAPVQAPQEAPQERVTEDAGSAQVPREAPPSVEPELGSSRPHEEPPTEIQLPQGLPPSVEPAPVQQEEPTAEVQEPQEVLPENSEPMQTEQQEESPAPVQAPQEAPTEASSAISEAMQPEQQGGLPPPVQEPQEAPAEVALMNPEPMQTEQQEEPSITVQEPQEAPAMGPEPMQTEEEEPTVTVGLTPVQEEPKEPSVSQDKMDVDMHPESDHDAQAAPDEHEEDLEVAAILADTSTVADKDTETSPRVHQSSVTVEEPVLTMDEKAMNDVAEQLITNVISSLTGSQSRASSAMDVDELEEDEERPAKRLRTEEPEVSSPIRHLPALPDEESEVEFESESEDDGEVENESSDMLVLTAKRCTNLTVKFKVTPEHVASMSKWRNRDGIRECLCLSLGCCTVDEFNRARQSHGTDASLEAIIRDCQVSWPKSNELKARIVNSIKNSVSIHLSPPALLGVARPGGMVDMTEYATEGENVLEIEYVEERAQGDFVLYLLLHRPTKAQRDARAERRRKDKEWRGWIKDMCKPLEGTSGPFFTLTGDVFEQGHLVVT